LPAAGGGLSNREIDELLADLADTTWTSNKEVVLTGENANYSIFGDTYYDWLVTNLTTVTLNGRVTDIDSGTCTAKKLYRIGATEVDHYFTGCAIGTETNDANNIVLEVTAPTVEGVTIVNDYQGTTYNWKTQDDDFDYNDTNHHTYNGTCTKYQLYRIVATETNHYFTGCAADDYFTSDGTETNDENNIVLKVITPSTSGVTIVNGFDSDTYQWLRSTGFDYNDSAGYTYEILTDSAEPASESIGMATFLFEITIELHRVSIRGAKLAH